jgi:hypothetical protein
MLYQYICFKCDEEFEIAKPHTEVDHNEICPICTSKLTLIPFSRMVFLKPDSFQPHFNPAFGRVVNSKRDMRNEVSRLNAENGYDLQEVGTDKPQKRKRERKMKEETLKDMAHEVKRIRGY